MPEAVISDTSCFITLSKIGELELLHKTYGKVITTLEVASEYGELLPDWVEINSPKDKSLQKKLEQKIDKGEASSIALAVEIKHCIIILDDYQARVVAKGLGIPYTGTIGVIIKAKKNSIIDSIRPYLEKIKSTNFRITAELELKALSEAGEI